MYGNRYRRSLLVAVQSTKAQLVDYTSKSTRNDTHGRLDHQRWPRPDDDGADDPIQVAQCAHFFKDFVEEAKAAVGAEAGFHCHGAFAAEQKLPASETAFIDLSTSSFPMSPSGFSFMDRGLPPQPRYVGADIPPAAWPKIAAARGLTVDSAKVGPDEMGPDQKEAGLERHGQAPARAGQQGPQGGCWLLAAGKAAESSLAAKRAAVAAAEDLSNLQDDTDCSEDDAGEIKYQYKNKKPEGTECGAYY
ncbi:hypothetical protein DL770_003610 [Monosporascus sp. CRB-9-2]|nr:hypothetical protein DL770_003610 [Monosporascus sp. CRB-9-2]